MAQPSQLLDFSTPVDVDLLESTVGLFYGAGTQEQVCLESQGALRLKGTHSIGCEHQGMRLAVPFAVHLSSGIGCHRTRTIAVLIQARYGFWPAVSTVCLCRARLQQQRGH